MFSRLLQFLQSFFTRSTTDANLNDPVLRSDPQVKAELAEVVDEGMVTTRLQEYVHSGTSLMGGLEDVAPESQPRERNINGVIKDSRTQPAEKRGHSSSVSPAPVERPPAVATHDPSTTAAKEIPEKADTFIHTSRPLSPLQVSSAPHPATNHKPPNAVSPVLDEPQHNDLLANGAVQVDIVKQNTVIPPRGPNARIENVPGSPKALVSGDRTRLTNEMTSRNSPTHKRFGSDEPGIIKVTKNMIRGADWLAVAVNTDMQYAEDNDDDDDGGHGGHGDGHGDDDEDDEPEIVTTSAGLEQAQRAAAGASQAIESQAATRKEKRRKLDAQLKRQVELAKKPRRRKELLLPRNDSNIINPNVGSDSENTHSTPRGRSSKIDPKNLPALLPDEILSKEPVIQHTIPHLSATTLKPTKRKFIDIEPKPPKDIKHGSVSVRVLQPTKFTLPPKAAKSSRQLKEAWLAGHRAGNGEFSSRRRRIEGGFLRK